MKIEVGKTYINELSEKVKIKFYDVETDSFIGAKAGKTNIWRAYREDGSPGYDAVYKLIKEQKELFKNSIECHLYYDDNPGDPNYILDALIGKDCSLLLRTHAQSNKMKVRLTVEELPED
jgi:hypothetical protein